MQNIPLNSGKDSWEITGHHYMMAEFLPGIWLLTSWPCNAGQVEMALHYPGKQGRNLLPWRGDEGGLLCAIAQSGTRVFGWGRELSELLLDVAFWRCDRFYPVYVISAVVLYQFRKVPDFGRCLRKYKKVPEEMPSTEAHSSFFLTFFFNEQLK